MNYESKQVATWGIALAALLGLGGLVQGALFALAGRQEALVGLGLVLVALLVANFAVLTVRVTDTEVRWSFGTGLIGRRVPLERVRGAAVRRSPWYWGWGIRWTPRGWLWRSSGLDAVWLELAGGKQIGVGSPDPAGLAHAIQGGLKRP